VKLGGRLAQHLHSIEIECEVDKIPEKIFVNISHLNIGDSITVKDLSVPQGPRSWPTRTKSWWSAIRRR